MIHFEQPAAFAALVLLLPLFWLWWRERRRPAAVVYSDLSLLKGVEGGWRARLSFLPRALRVLFVIAAAAALARPQAGVRTEEVTTYGVDIAVALDRSGSMQALDLKPDRLTVAKETILDFVQRRPTDRIGMVVFAREAFTACPLTLDHAALATMVRGVDFARRDEDGTAMGLGLAAAVNRLRGSDAKSLVIVLVTDGVNNSGSIAPLTAAELAKERGIRIYTIGVGTHGLAPMPMRDAAGRRTIAPVEVEIDEETLRAIASSTDGRYFRADDRESLEEIFRVIDGLEKTEITSQIHVDWSDRFEGLLLLAGVFFLAEVLLARFALGRLP